MKYKQASEQQIKEIWRVVDKWWENSPLSPYYNNIGAISKSLIMEYIANQKGLTLITLAKV